MNRNLRHASFGAVLLLVAGAATAQAADKLLVLGVPVAGGAAGSVNVLFRDFSTATLDPDFEWIRNTIELQVTPSLTDQDLQSLFLNFNPDLDISKLALYWTGAPMPVPGIPPGGSTFPGSGDKPSGIAIASNVFYAGGGQLFDILAQWDAGMTFSKLLLVYNNANTDIGFDDVFVTSSTVPSYTGPNFGPLLAAGAVVGPEGQGTVAAIPEPSVFAMLGMGLLAVAGAAWRRRA